MRLRDIEGKDYYTYQVVFNTKTDMDILSYLCELEENGAYKAKGEFVKKALRDAIAKEAGGQA